MSAGSTLWRVSDTDLADLDALRARDLLVECMFRAQRGNFKREATSLDAGRHEEELRNTVRAAIRLKFKDLGCDYEQPTTRDISRVAQVLASETRAWGTPEDVVEHHIDQMRIIEQRLGS